MLHLTPMLIAGWALALFGAASRLAPFTKHFWDFFGKKVAAVLPGIVAGLPTAYAAFQNVKTWLDVVQAVLITAAVVGGFALPGASSPHNHPDQMAAAAAKKAPSIPPLPILFLMAVAFGTVIGCAALPVAKAVDQAAVLLCADFFSAKHPGLSLHDVEAQFCSAAEDIAPFLAQAKAAEHRAGAQLEAQKAGKADAGAP